MRHFLTQAFVVALLVCGLHGTARSTPDCYSNATMPAHTWALVNAKKSVTIPAITGLTPDGLQCKTIPLWQGEPVLVQPILSPFRQLVESYATALKAKDTVAIQRLYSWLRPTPRTFGKYLELAFVQEGFPMDLGGNATAAQLLSLLQTTPQVEKYIVSVSNTGIINVPPASFWPALYMLMGGILLPDPPGVWTGVPADAQTGYAEEFAQGSYPVMLRMSMENEGNKQVPRSIRAEWEVVPDVVESTSTDDPRLRDTNFLQSLAAEGNPVDTPVVVSPESYVRLHPALEKRLMGALRVHPHNTVKENGPMLPVTAAFSAIADRVDYDMRRTDFAHILQLKAKVKAAPLSPQAILGLLHMPLWSAKDVDVLVQHLKLAVQQSTLVGPVGQGPGFWTGHRSQLTQADLFAEFRGNSSSAQTIAAFSYEGSSSTRLAQIKARFAAAQLKDTLLMPVKFYAGAQCVKSLRRFGFAIVQFK